MPAHRPRRPESSECVEKEGVLQWESIRLVKIWWGIRKKRLLCHYSPGRLTQHGFRLVLAYIN